MSNLIDNAYTQLNNLTQINADDIQTESINTKTLYINNVLFDPSGIDTSDLVTLSTNQTNISGQKTFTTSPILSASLILNGSLFVNNSNIVISNTRLGYLSSLSSNVQTQLDTLATKLTNQTYTAGTTTTTISNNLSLTNVSFSGNISTFSKTNFDNAINRTFGLTSDCQTQINSINTSLSNYVLSSALTTHMHTQGEQY
jgi:hypothetical protein